MKKLLSILLALCLIAVCLTACAKEEEKPEETAELPLAITYDAAYSNYDESVYSAYESLCTAIFNGETSARMNVGLFEDVLQLYYTSFPLNVLAEVIENPDGSGALISYKEDAETTKQNIAAFAEKINAIKTQCFDGTVSQTLFALNAYRYICESFQAGDGQNVYETVMNGNGNTDSYTRLFEYLLQQAGVPAYHVLAMDAAGATVPMTQASLDGQLYYFDVMMEQIVNCGTALRYFGMTTDDMTANQIGKTMQYHTKKFTFSS